ncbi:UDP-glycosyltransferase 79B11 [Vitis vinifera]|uniref:UDP-glycosyltransferase 79B11 n=1 Tax=Vitis vinifera TaxID=29760 RepID=A0A438BSV4_VITVI|nr:UDP-glycosyltransferase 79B11 [Vitis vinifera]
MAMVRSPKLHIAMYPWFAFGHMIPYLHLSNELVERGHSITFILPKKVQSQLQHLNLHPTLISFHPLTILHVDGLPPSAETASDVPISLHHLLAAAMDRTTDQVEAALLQFVPQPLPTALRLNKLAKAGQFQLGLLLVTPDNHNIQTTEISLASHLSYPPDKHLSTLRDNP